MTDLDHPRENPVSRLALSVGRDLLSYCLPGSGSIIDVLNEFKRKKIQHAQDSLLEELRGTERELSDVEKSEFIPAAYKSFQAAAEGVSNRNIKLLAKLFREEIDKTSLNFDEYATVANISKFLSISELAALYIVIKHMPSPTLSEDRGSVIEVDREHYENIEKQCCAEFATLFPNEDSAMFTLASLSGKGLMVPIITMRFGSNSPLYFPTNLAVRIGKHAQSILDMPRP